MREFDIFTGCWGAARRDRGGEPAGGGEEGTPGAGQDQEDRGRQGHTEDVEGAQGKDDAQAQEEEEEEEEVGFVRLAARCLYIFELALM